MQQYVDLSHTIESGMITSKGLPAPLVCDFLSREDSVPFNDEGTTFQIGKIEMVANTGTYLDNIPDRPFLFSAIPPKIVGMESFPVRAFAKMV